MRKIYQNPNLVLLILLLSGGFFLAERVCAAFEEPSPQLLEVVVTPANTPEVREEVVFLPVLIQGGGSGSGGGTNSWPMAGANPERTSWTSTEVKQNLDIAWYKPFDAFILPHVQIIAANNLLYISTANGLYALNASTGAKAWVYPTEMPLGNSPTISDGVAYVGGYDRKIHAINALTGAGLWTFEAGAGFDTNPLIVNGILYAGNRDGYLYALHTTGANKGKLLWKYDTGGPIHYSTAFKDGVVYFASNSSRVYALNAQTGALVWKTNVLPGAGFHAWWPVIYENYVIVAGSHNYRFSSNLGPGALDGVEKNEVYPNYQQDPRGTLVGPMSQAPGEWAAGTPTIDASQPNTTPNGQTLPITEYLESKPWRRTYFVFNRLTGEEYTTDFDNDGKAEYAPFLWVGSQGAGNRYPPVVGGDGVLYQANNYMSDPVIAGGHLTGWVPGSKYFTVISSDWGAVDEPVAYSAGGDVVYWNLCCDRQLGAIDIMLPNINFLNRYNAGFMPPTGAFDGKREWLYFNYNLEEKIPGYDEKYFGGPMDMHPVFGSQDGVYGNHGYQNPPIPYNNMVFVHRSNAVLAFTPDQVSPIALPSEPIVAAPDQTTPLPVDELVERLETEVQKMVDAGHLMPGYASAGIFDLRARFDCGDDLVDYWHSPGDSLYTLLQALPHLSPALQADVRTYLEAEFAAFPPYSYNHIGWQDGVPRDVFIFPPEVVSAQASYAPKTVNTNFEGWSFNPFAFYAMWKYAEEFDGASAILNASDQLLGLPPINAILTEMPHVLNAYIAGYDGYLHLQDLAGVPSNLVIQTELQALKLLRVAQLNFELPSLFFTESDKFYCRSLSVSRNFMYMTPELADYLHDNALSKTQTAVNEYEDLAPYWFVSRLEVTFGEGVLRPYYDYHTLFQAKARILQEPYDTMVNYLDVPAVAVGDLYYMQNLIALIELSSE